MEGTNSTTSRGGLIALNLLLLVVLAIITLAPSSSAQNAGAMRSGNQQYLAVSGEVNGLTSGVVYITDTTTNGGQLIAATWDRNANRIVILGQRQIAEDVAEAKKN